MVPRKRVDKRKGDRHAHRPFSVRLGPDLTDRLEALSARLGVPVPELARQAIQELLDRYKEQGQEDDGSPVRSPAQDEEPSQTPPELAASAHVSPPLHGGRRDPRLACLCAVLSDTPNLEVRDEHDSPAACLDRISITFASVSLAPGFLERVISVPSCTLSAWLLTWCPSQALRPPVVRRTTRTVPALLSRRAGTGSRGLTLRKECWGAETTEGVWEFEREDSPRTPWLVYHRPTNALVDVGGTLRWCRWYVAAGHAQANLERLLAHERGERDAGS